MNAFLQRKLAICLTGLLLFSPFASLGAPDRFARFSTQPTRLYAGQTFDLTLSVYTTGETLDKSITISGMPPADALRCNPFQELALQQEIIESRTYEVRRFRTQATTPSPGPLLLTPALQGNLIRETRSYFFVQRQSVPVAIPVERFTLSPLPLPTEGRPPSFSGAVGEFTLHVKVSPLDVAVGDIVTLDVRIEGLGLPEALSPPALPPNDGIKAYETKFIPSESSPTVRIFRQTVVPADPSLPALPALSFCFFNTRTGQYETQTAGPFPLTFHAEHTPPQRVYTPPTNTATPKHPPIQTTAPGLWQRLLACLNRNPTEQITVSTDTEVRLAPAEGAIILFKLKPGTAVKVEARSEDWLRIEAQDGTGWILSPTPPQTKAP